MTHLFDDLLHQCPALSATLADLPRQSLSALLATNHYVRDRISAVLQEQCLVCLMSFATWIFDGPRLVQGKAVRCRGSGLFQGQVLLHMPGKHGLHCET